jgi:hypothetical protein
MSDARQITVGARACPARISTTNTVPGGVAPVARRIQGARVAICEATARRHRVIRGCVPKK